MTEPSHLIWHLESVAELRSPTRLHALGLALDSEPLLRFTKGGRTFPPKRRITKGAAGLLQRYEHRLDGREPEMWFFAREEEPGADLDILLVDDRRSSAAGRSHALNGRFWTPGWFSSPDRLLRLGRYLEQVADAAGAFYGYCTLSELEDQRVELLKRNGETWVGRLLRSGRVIVDLQRELPDVYWWNYFGRAYVAKWGKSLDGLGVRAERTHAGARVIWATETPFVFDGRVSRLEGYPWKKKFYDALGPDTFMREGQKQRAVGEVVPDLSTHRAAAGATSSRVADVVEKRERVLPRIVTAAGSREDAVDELGDGGGLEVRLRSAGSLSAGEVRDWLRRGHEDAVDGRLSQGRPILYRNPDTAVTAAFELTEGGLLFWLPYVRPSFFAQEAAPLVVDLARDLSLEMPSNTATAELLTDQWKRGNDAAVRDLGEKPPYMDPARSRRWWLYQNHKAELHARFGEDVFVPTLVAVGPARRTDDLQLHITWTDAVPLVLAECDLVTLVTGSRPSDFRIRGTVAYADARRALAPYLEDLEVVGLGVLGLLPPQEAKKARHVFDHLQTSPADHVEVDAAGWVDVR